MILSLLEDVCVLLFKLNIFVVNALSVQLLRAADVAALAIYIHENNLWNSSFVVKVIELKTDVMEEQNKLLIRHIDAPRGRVLKLKGDLKELAVNPVNTNTFFDVLPHIVF